MVLILDIQGDHLCGGCSSVGSSARLWFWMSRVQIPPAAPIPRDWLLFYRRESGRSCERGCPGVTSLVPAELLHGAFRLSPSVFGRFPESDGVGLGRIRRFELRIERGVVPL